MQGIGRFFLFSLIVMSVTTCKEASDDNGSKGKTSFSDKEYQKYVEAICSYTKKCSPNELLNYPGGDLQGCIDFNMCLFSFYKFMMEEMDSIHYGNFSLDKCSSYLDSADCGASVFESALATPGSPCNTSVAMSEGEACDLEIRYWACDKGLYCAPSATDEFCGTCERRQPLGETCSKFQGKYCVEDGFCSNDGTCKPVKELGASCEGEVFGECANGTCREGQCSKLGKGLGEECDEDGSDFCDKGLECVEGRCAPRSDIGEDCGDDDDCRLSLACIDETCTETGCNPEIGERCTENFSLCGEDSFCATETHTCAPYAQIDESCGSDDMYCANGLRCDSQTDTCKPQKKVGEPCEDLEDCETYRCSTMQEICVEEPVCAD